jgi:hypothetical protein
VLVSTELAVPFWISYGATLERWKQPFAYTTPFGSPHLEFANRLQKRVLWGDAHSTSFLQPIICGVQALLFFGLQELIAAN